jgi:hypothetical protein
LPLENIFVLNQLSLYQAVCCCTFSIYTYVHVWIYTYVYRCEHLHERYIHTCVLFFHALFSFMSLLMYVDCLVVFH